MTGRKTIATGTKTTMIEETKKQKQQQTITHDIGKYPFILLGCTDHASTRNIKQTRCDNRSDNSNNNKSNPRGVVVMNPLGFKSFNLTMITAADVTQNQLHRAVVFTSSHSNTPQQVVTTVKNMRRAASTITYKHQLIRRCLTSSAVSTKLAHVSLGSLGHRCYLQTAVCWFTVNESTEWRLL